MLTRRDDTGYREMLDGVLLKSLVWGDRTLLTEVRLAQGAVVPVHDHAHEQTGYLVSGRLEFTIDGATWVAGPGDSWSLAGGLAHGARALEDCVVVEVFAPVREDYLP
jgi:quercetin dioxygenase-like cupin family protein